MVRAKNVNVIGYLRNIFFNFPDIPWVKAPFVF